MLARLQIVPIREILRQRLLADCPVGDALAVPTRQPIVLAALVDLAMQRQGNLSASRAVARGIGSTSRQVQLLESQLVVMISKCCVDS